MARLVAVPLESGEPLVIETDDSEEGGVVRAARPGESFATATQSFETALERFRPMAEVVVSKLSGLAQPPSGLVVEFGIKLSAQAGLVVAQTSGESNFKVTLEWRRP